MQNDANVLMKGRKDTMSLCLDAVLVLIELELCFASFQLPFAG